MEKVPKNLRPQFGRFYDVKKVRNSCRLSPLADRLQENNLAAVRILPKRYAELERNQPYVAFIGIKPIAKG